MKFMVAAAALVLFSSSALAVTPRAWTTATTEEFMAGELEQIGLTSSGSLVPAPAATRIASVPDPFVLSQAVDSQGRRFLGTGNNGNVYRVAADGTLTLLFSAPEPEIYAVAVRDGMLYAASSPWGSIYRIDPSSGSATPVWKSEHAYIWTLATDRQGLLIGTGLEGGIYRMTPQGTVNRIWEAPESHVRSLTVRSDGTILAGGSGEGRIYSITPAGDGQALYDSAHSEITAVAWGKGQPTGWAAAAAGALPATPPQRTDSRQQSSSDDQKDESDAEQGTATVEVTISGDSSGAQATPPTISGGSELYRIHPDGFVELVRKFDRETIYALQPASDGVLVGTGPEGRIYHVSETQVTLIGSTREKQVMSIEADARGYVVTTTNSGAVIRLASDSSAAGGVWTSPVRDAAIFSRWGAWSLTGNDLNDRTVRVGFRSGNSSTPDATWSDWNEAPGADGEVTAPSARYLQYRVTLVAPSDSMRVDRMRVSYQQRNTAPVVESITVHDPGVVFLTGSSAAPSQLVEATNPDEHGIFSSLDAPRDRNDAGRRAFRKSYRTIAWKARDENSDTLTYDVTFRPVGSGSWLRLRENLEETQINFDTSQLPDGEYEVRVAAHDEKDNPEGALTATRQGAWFTVDNTAPVVTSSARGRQTRIVIRDSGSPVMRVEMAVDAEKWVRLVPDDGISDSREESYTIPTPDAAGFAMVRALDSHYNVTTARVAAP